MSRLALYPSRGQSGVTVSYHRYTVEQTYECETVEQALSFLAYGEEHGELSSFCSRVVAGDRVIEGDELAGLVEAKWGEIDRIAG